MLQIPGEWISFTNRDFCVRQLRDLEVELDEERKQRASAVAARKKLEGDFKSMEHEVDAANKAKEDLAKQLKKLQVIFTIHFVCLYVSGLIFQIAVISEYMSKFRRLKKKKKEKKEKERKNHSGII